MQEFLAARGLSAPTPGPSDLTDFTALQQWHRRTFGISMPEAEFRHTWDSTSDGRPARARNFPGASAFAAIMTSGRKYTSIPAPALVVFAIPHVQDTWMTASSDPAVRTRAEAYFTTVDTLAAKQAKAIEDEVPTARVVRLRGLHYIFLSNEGDVLREIRGFLTSLMYP